MAQLMADTGNAAGRKNEQHNDQNAKNHLYQLRLVLHQQQSYDAR